MQEKQMSDENDIHLKIVDARCTWRPCARYLAWRWKKKGYRTAYQPVTLCKALVGAVDFDHSGE
nr:MAG TPA: hypothetical protein [Caudoviricetes sp.]